MSLSPDPLLLPLPSREMLTDPKAPERRGSVPTRARRFPRRPLCKEACLTTEHGKGLVRKPEGGREAKEEGTVVLAARGWRRRPWKAGGLQPTRPRVLVMGRRRRRRCFIQPRSTAAEFQH